MSEDFSLQLMYDDEEDGLASMESYRPINVDRRSMSNSLNRRVRCNVRLNWLILRVMIIFMVVAILSVKLSGASNDPLISSAQEIEGNAENAVLKK